MGIKHTIKLVKKVLKSKSKFYTEEELMYMRRQLGIMKEERRARKILKKQQQGFGNVECETNSPQRRIRRTKG